MDYLKITSPSAQDVAGLVIRATAYSLALAEAGGVEVPLGVAGAGARAGSFAAGRLVPRAMTQSLTCSRPTRWGRSPNLASSPAALTLSGTLASPGSLSAGDRVTAVLDNCEDIPGSVGDGRGRPADAGR